MPLEPFVATNQILWIELFLRVLLTVTLGLVGGLALLALCALGSYAVGRTVTFAAVAEKPAVGRARRPEQLGERR